MCVFGPCRLLQICLCSINLLNHSFTILYVVIHNSLCNTGSSKCPVFSYHLAIIETINETIIFPFSLFQTSSTPTSRWRCRMSKAQLLLCGGTSHAGNRISCCKLLNTNTADMLHNLINYLYLIFFIIYHRLWLKSVVDLIEYTKCELCTLGMFLRINFHFRGTNQSRWLIVHFTTSYYTRW